MKSFRCRVCGNQVYFENTHCGHCKSALGFDSERLQLLSLLNDGDETWRTSTGENAHFRICANADPVGCNWLIPTSRGDTELCAACTLNRTVPDTGLTSNVELWRRMEVAKRRLIYSLLRLQLPLKRLWKDGDGGLAFDFLAGPDLVPQAVSPVLTGHAGGVITINLAEADDAMRERNRQNMAEPYRTLLGHFRHEIGHYYWDHLVRSKPAEAQFRRAFGDERKDYGAALEKYYKKGAPSDWNDHFVSRYASAHPWEDFAETWAHYLHIVDTMETARAIGLKLEQADFAEDDVRIQLDTDPYRTADFDELVRLWLPLARAINSLNRSMGQPDLYPFVLSAPVLKKLNFVDRLIRTDPSAASWQIMDR